MNKTHRHSNKQRFAFWPAVVFLVLLVSLGACKGDQLLGLEVQPEGSLDPIQKLDSFTVQAKTVLLDEPQVSTNFQNFVGTMSNNVFGRSSASLYLNFILESENIALDLEPEEYVVDSLILNIRASHSYGNPTENQLLEVFVIDEEIISDSNYTSDKAFQVDDAQVGSLAISFNSENEISELFTSPDSVYKGIQFYLDNDLGEFLLQGLGREYATSAQLQEYFPGLLIENNAPNSVQNGAIYNFITSGGSTGLTLYFHPKNNSNVDEAESLTFLTSGSTSRFNRFDNDRSTALVSNYLNDLSKGTEFLFVQGMSGVRTELFFPSLNDFAKATDIAVNLARLRIKTSDVQPSGLDYSPELILLDFEVDPSTGDTLETLNLDYTFSTSRHGGELSDDKSEYNFEVTRQIQKIIESVQDGSNANLGFTLNAQVPILNGNVCTQTVLKGSDNIVLEIFYTDINE